MNAKKRTSLDAVFGTDEHPAIALSRASGEKTTAQRPAADGPAEDQPPKRAGAPKRPNVKQHTAYLSLPGHEQLRKLAFEENCKIHDYFIEGLDRVFADRGLPALKDLS
jgi:hypothetical protein